ncbi:MAG TPA: M20/M25/M40 family metallo-hydrolase [Burkholderiaceae bacterium]|nr:M20/M25/M40 family metallo-hydrolase [Burkholderiaceae bacterium]HMY98321.1 M20/M25/M40 family metallo-hydrolase [Burkholderiaceae bacterium]HNB42844.1 M20/M25/M40 family metallo-hydrolase [Burkholderiaceae bacterium]HNG78854.1 M20/M25/M40 family metallo-hydrolase [Burkholderiaceae bacterium]
MSTSSLYQAIDAYVDAHFDEQVRFLQELVRVPTDTPPGNNTPHALRTRDLLAAFGFEAQAHEVPTEVVTGHGLQSITNLVVQRRYAKGGRVVALNAHGDVVPPGEGWTHDPYGAQIVDGKLYGRAAAVSKCDFSTFTFATRALEAAGVPLAGGVDLLFTYDEEFGGELGPQWLLDNGHTKPDLEIAAGFSYQVVTAHNGCLQLEATVHGKMGHAAVPETAVDALQAATKVLVALYAENARLRQTKSAVKGINFGYINVGQIFGGTNTNVVPGKVVLKIDRRMIPEEDPAQVEAALRQLIEGAVADAPGTSVDIKRLLLAHAMKPLAGNKPLVDALCTHATELMGETVEASGTPLYTDARLFSERGIPAVIYGAGPRTVLESNAKRADEHIVLEDLRRATKVVARTLLDLLKA